MATAISDADTPPHAETERTTGLTVWSVLALVFVAATMTYAFEAAVHFSGVAIDGPFQLYNSLRRIQAGFHPGVDFQYFHGLGIPYSHYWLYRLLGGGLRGSELSRQLITAALYPVVPLVVFRAFTKSWTKALCLTVAMFAASYALKMSQVIFALNGMLGVRSALPTMLPAVLFAVRSPRLRTALTGAILGGSLFVSTEQGLAVMLAYGLVSAILLVRSNDRRGAAVELVSAIAIGVALLVVLLLAVGGVSGMRGALHYNFQIVPMDQYWYFGAPPNIYVPSWGLGFRMVLATPAVAVALIGGLTTVVVYLRRAWIAPDDESRRWAYALAVVSVYALVSCASLLGVFTPAYVQPARRVLLLIVLLELWAYAERFDGRRDASGWLGVPRGIAVATGAITGYAFLAVTLLPATLAIALPHVIVGHAFGNDGFTMSGIWPESLREGQKAIDTHRRPAGQPPSFWSTYAGWLEARNGMFHPDFDYIIHALGPDNRQSYVERFEATQPTLVQTVRPTYTQYEAWLENYEWAFYDELLDWYAVSSTTPWSFIWERRATQAPAPQPVGEMNVPPGVVDIPLPPLPTATAPLNVLEIEVDYEVHNPWRRLPVIGASPRFLIGIGGAASRFPVSLNPWTRRMRFPIVVRPGEQPVLHFQTASLLPGASWTAKTLRLWQRPIDAQQAPWLADLDAFLRPAP